MKPICDSDMIINIGPQSPALYGSMKLAIKLNGEIIKSVESVIGYNHRGIEKLAESIGEGLINVLDSLMDAFADLLNSKWFQNLISLSQYFSPLFSLLLFVIFRNFLFSD